MNMGVLGTGMVGRAIAGKLASNGHDVKMGSRDPEAALARTEPGNDGTMLADWKAANRDVAIVPFAAAADHAKIIFNATSGSGAMDALVSAGEQNLAGKVLINVSNPLDFSKGMPPSLFVSNTDSLAEQIQQRFPEAKVVESLNTVNAAIMVHPSAVADGDHTMFLCGNDDDARSTVALLLNEEFGWRNVLDLGDLTAARALEMYVPLWVRLFATLGNPMFSVKVVS